MKKQPRTRRIIRVFTSIFNIRYWIDWDRIQAFALFLGQAGLRLFVPQQKTKSQSFKAAQKGLHLSDADLLSKQKALFRLSMIMLASGTAILIYAMYHLFYGTWKAFIVSLVVVLISLALAFRYHFWYFQIKNRTLGCTLGQWYKLGIRGKNE